MYSFHSESNNAPTRIIIINYFFFKNQLIQIIMKKNVI